MVPIDDDQASNRRTYGRGLADGLKLAGVSNVKEVMSQKKLSSALAGTHGVERKIYECMPSDRAVKVHEIVTIMARGTGSRPDTSVVEGLIYKLRDKDLVVETPTGTFRRVTFKPEFVTPAPALTVVDKSPAPVVRDVPPSPPPLDRLADLHQRLCVLAAELADVGVEVAKLLEDSRPKVRPPAALLREMLKLLEDE